MPCLSQYCAIPSMISTVACGFTKFAVPTATAVAPASMNSTASVAHEMPPIPSSGTSTAW